MEEAASLPVETAEAAQLKTIVERSDAWEAHARHLLKHPAERPATKSDDAGALLAQADRLCVSLDERLFRKLAAALGFMEDLDEDEEGEGEEEESDPQTVGLDEGLGLGDWGI